MGAPYGSTHYFYIGTAMKLFFALLLIIFLAFSGYHLSFRELKLPVVARKFYLTGTEFLFLGLLLGPEFVNMFDAGILKGLEPLSGLILGWIGLLFGLQFEINKMRRFPVEYFRAATVEGLVTGGVVLTGTFLVLYFFFRMDLLMIGIVSMALSASAACTAQTGLALVAPGLIAKRQETASILRYISSFDGLIALCFLGLSYLLRPLAVAGYSWGGVIGYRTVIAVGTFVVILFLYTLFMGGRRNEKELLLVMIGMAVLTSGTASVLNFSPLIMNFLMGVCLVNLSRQKELIFQILISVEKPVYIMLMVFLGISWHLTTVWPFILGAGFCVLRITGKFSGGYMVSRFIPGMQHVTRQLGFGLIEQGGLSLAVLYDFQYGVVGDLSAHVLSVVIVSVMISDVVSMHYLLRLFKKESG